MYEAHAGYAHTLKEIADRASIHYGTVSRIAKKMSEIKAL